MLLRRGLRRTRLLATLVPIGLWQERTCVCQAPCVARHPRTGCLERHVLASQTATTAHALACLAGPAPSATSRRVRRIALATAAAPSTDALSPCQTQGRATEMPMICRLSVAAARVHVLLVTRARHASSARVRTGAPDMDVATRLSRALARPDGRASIARCERALAGALTMGIATTALATASPGGWARIARLRLAPSTPALSNHVVALE